MNYCLAQWQGARQDLAAANRDKAPRAEIMRRLSHYRNEVLKTAIALRELLITHSIRKRRSTWNAGGRCENR